MLSPNLVTDIKRKYSELSSSDDESSESDDEPIIDKIDRMANEDSGTDDDFIVSNIFLLLSYCLKLP